MVKSCCRRLLSNKGDLSREPAWFLDIRFRLGLHIHTLLSILGFLHFLARPRYEWRLIWHLSCRIIAHISASPLVRLEPKLADWRRQHFSQDGNVVYLIRVALLMCMVEWIEIPKLIASLNSWFGGMSVFKRHFMAFFWLLAYWSLRWIDITLSHCWPRFKSLSLNHLKWR